MPKTVLIADESVTIRSVAESLLRGEGYSVRSAADGSMAVELARSERPDLILIGEKLPGMTGADVCTELKSHPELRSIPLVFMRTDRPGNGPKNADAVLLKPFSPQSLIDTARRFLNPAGATQTGHFVSVEDPGLADELIDHALGLDDVGAVPAEEREVKPIVTVEEEPFQSAAEPSPSAPAFGIYPGEPHTEVTKEPAEEPAIEHVSEEAGGTLSDFQVQIGMEESSLTADGSGNRDDIDVALDEALGSRPGPQETSSVNVTPHNSLNEISLGETGSVPTARGHVPPSAPQSMDLSGIDEEPEVERPHDYEWFIAEMAKDSKPQSQQPRPEERPRIEPVVTKLPQPGPTTPEFAGTTRIQMPEMKKEASSEFDVNVEEFETSKRGYDEFISEFRKEIARLEGTVPPSEEDHTQHSSKGTIALKDTKSGGDAVRMDVAQLGDQLIEEVAQRVARELAAKIDSKAIYAMIEDRLRQMGKQ